MPMGVNNMPSKEIGAKEKIIGSVVIVVLEVMTGSKWHFLISVINVKLFIKFPKMKSLIYLFNNVVLLHWLNKKRLQ